MHQFPQLSNLLHTALLGGAIITTATLSLLSPTLSSSVRASLHDSPKAVLDEAWQIVYQQYVDTNFNQVDWLAVRQELLNVDYASEQEAYTALRDALERLNDPYTRFMDPEQYRALTRQTAGELSGVGIRLEINSETNALTVVEPLPNSPAASAGIRTGDRVLAIDGRSTSGMSVEDASRLIRGEAGTDITLSISRDGSRSFDIPLTRARIELPTVRYSLRQEGDQKIGYIRLGEFSSHAAEQMRRAIRDLASQGAEGFVLDLRGNPGGLLQASIDISRMWIEAGDIVRTVDRNGESRESSANHTALTELPLAVLVDGNSASSSEILTGALMDNRRATVVGTQTFGKALVQSVHALDNGAGLAVTIAHYYTPAGTDISQRGITPNIEINLTDAQRQRLASTPALLATTEADPQYAGAIAALQPDIAANRNPPQPTQPMNIGQERLNAPH
jgi:carboxyl-terminal processing protease